MAATTGLPVRRTSGLTAVPFLTATLTSLPVYPLVFHSIPDEIPQASQPLITRLYQLWLFLLVTLLVNMVACIVILASGASGGGSDLGSSIG